MLLANKSKSGGGGGDRRPAAKPKKNKFIDDEAGRGSDDDDDSDGERSDSDDDVLSETGIDDDDDDDGIEVNDGSDDDDDSIQSLKRRRTNIDKGKGKAPSKKPRSTMPVSDDDDDDDSMNDLAIVGNPRGRGVSAVSTSKSKAKPEKAKKARAKTTTTTTTTTTQDDDDENETIDDISDSTGRVLGSDEEFRATFTQKQLLLRVIMAHHSVMQEARFDLRFFEDKGILTVEGIDSNHTTLGRSTLDCHFNSRDNTKHYNFYIKLENIRNWLSQQKNTSFIDIVQKTASSDSVEFIAYEPQNDFLSDSSFTESVYDEELQASLKPFSTEFPLEMETAEFRQIVASCLSGKAVKINISISKVELNREQCEATGMDPDTHCMITKFEGLDDQGKARTCHRMLSLTNVNLEKPYAIQPDKTGDAEDGNAYHMTIQADSSQLSGTDQGTRRARHKAISSGVHRELVRKSYPLAILDHILKPMDKGSFQIYIAAKGPLVMRFPLGNFYSKVYFAIAPHIEEKKCGE